jgi:small GTP-binding protein
MSAEARPARSSAIKIVLVGQTRVGKSCILDRQLNGTFEGQMPNTIGTALATTIIETPEGVFRLQLWDTAGQEQYIALASLYYRNAHIALLVFDLTRRDTLLALERWAAEVRERAPARISLVLIGNKCDLDTTRQIHLEEILQFRKKIGASQYFETSAKTGLGVDQLFRSIVKLRSDPHETSAVGPLVLTEAQISKKGCCS